MKKKLLSGLAFGCCFALAVGVVWAQEVLDGGQVEIIPPDGTRLAIPDKTLLNDVDEGRALQSLAPSADRWIGVAVGPVPDILRAHVSLPAGVGVLVEQVIPDSPAARAGLQRHDIVTALDGNLLTDAKSLVDGVRAAQDGSLELKWMRGGQQMNAQITPAARPKTLKLDRGQRWPGGTAVNPQELGRLRDWIDRLEKNRGGPGRTRFHFFGPNFGPNAGPGQAFENNIKVQIERQNDEPAKITVEKDGDTWELTENDLDQLPPDVRAHVQSMLGGRMQFNLPNLPRAFPQGVPPIQQLLPEDFSFPEFENQLEEMNQRMEQMFDELRQLRQQQPVPVPAPEDLDLEGGDEA